MSSPQNSIWILKFEQVQLWISCIFSWKDLNNWLAAGLLGWVLNLLPEVCSSCSLIRTKDMFLPNYNWFMCLSAGRNPEGWFIAGCVLLVAGCDLLTLWCVRRINTSRRCPLNSSWAGVSPHSTSSFHSTVATCRRGSKCVAVSFIFPHHKLSLSPSSIFHFKTILHLCIWENIG